MDETSRAPGRSGDTAEVTVTSLLDRLEVGVVMLDPRGRVLLWSPVAEAILGWPGERVIGRPFSDLLVHEDQPTTDGTGVVNNQAAGPGALWEGDGEQLYAALLREHSWRGPLWLRRKDAPPLHIEAQVHLLIDSSGQPFVLASIIEMSRLRKVEQDLAALDALYGSTHVGVAIFDTDKRYVRANEALARMHGRPVTDLLGRTVRDLLPEPVASELSALQDDVLRTGRPVVDKTVSGVFDEGVRTVSYARLTDRDGEVMGVSATVMDVTERVAAMEKIEKARQRLKLLDDVGVALGELLDAERISEQLASYLVPRFADYAGVMLHEAVLKGGELPEPPADVSPLVLLGAASRDRGPLVDQLFHPGMRIPFEPISLFRTVMETGEPRLLTSEEEFRAAALPGGPRGEAAARLGIHTTIAAPLSARGRALGLMVVGRAGDSDAYDEDDLALAMELASRGGISLENARLYTRERETALMLQRGLLPQRVPSPPGVRIAYRYVPGSRGTEVGGDWFDVIHLAGGRLALVVGDVMGHGLRAAATMGRMRTAVRTLAGLDLPPADLLRRVNDLADDLSPGPEFPLMATCLYAVYDPSTRRCSLAKAGHVPPVLITLDEQDERWTARPLDLPSGAPFGVGDVQFEEREEEVAEGTVLVLYTDGLIETRDEDIGVGLSRLCERLERTGRHFDLEEVCDDLLASVGSEIEADDVSVLMAQLGELPEGSSVSWRFPAEPAAVREVRATVRRTLRDWGLQDVADTATLLVSELVTNSLRHASGPIGVRMVRGTSLLVEVSDPLPEPPRERQVRDTDEGGRGMQLVSGESRRWGTRHGPLGKTVWFELTLPG